MKKILSDAEVLRDFAEQQIGEPTLEPLKPDEVKHEFKIGGVTWTCFAQDGRGIELIVDDIATPDAKDVRAMSQAERDQLQKGIDATIQKLRAKVGRKVFVFGADVPPVWDDLHDGVEHENDQ